MKPTKTFPRRHRFHIPIRPIQFESPQGFVRRPDLLRRWKSLQFSGSFSPATPKFKRLRFCCLKTNQQYPVGYTHFSHNFFRKHRKVIHFSNTSKLPENKLFSCAEISCYRARNNKAPEYRAMRQTIRKIGRISMYSIMMRGITLVLTLMIWTGVVQAAPYAALVMDARTGEVLHSRNADTRLHPASLTKMMTLYIVFNEVEAGRLSLDQQITISRAAAAEPPSKLGLRAGQTIALRYLIRAAAVKSANDAAHALADAVSGSEDEFARYMNQVARQMGMNNTHFLNPHGLTEVGHYSTARDMSILGRRLFYDFPQYYNLFSRISTSTPIRTVYNTNRRFLQAYQGADGIKTGYTSAAGFNLVASAERGTERIIATMFGGTSTQQRNNQVAKLLDMGFERAPSQVAVVRPPRLTIVPPGANTPIRLSGLVTRADRPVLRRVTEDAAPSLVMMTRNIDELVSTVVADTSLVPPVTDADEITEAITAALPTDAIPDIPVRRPDSFTPTAEAVAMPVQTASLVPQSVLGSAPQDDPGDWSVQLGTYGNRTNTEKLLIQTALMDLDSLQGAERRVEVTQVEGMTMYRARFVGLSESAAMKACERLQSRDAACEVISPGA